MEQFINRKILRIHFNIGTRDFIHKLFEENNIS